MSTFVSSINKIKTKDKKTFTVIRRQGGEDIPKVEKNYSKNVTLYEVRRVSKSTNMFKELESMEVKLIKNAYIPVAKKAVDTQ